MHYQDSPRGISKRVRVDAGKVTAVRLSGETAAFAWLRDAMVEDVEVAVLRSRSEEHTSELQSLMRISYAVFCLKKKTKSVLSHSLIASPDVRLTNTMRY